MNITLDKMAHEVTMWGGSDGTLKLESDSCGNLEEALELAASFAILVGGAFHHIDIVGTSHYTVTDNGEDNYADITPPN